MNKTEASMCILSKFLYCFVCCDEEVRLVQEFIPSVNLKWGIGSVSVSVDVDEVDEGGAHSQLAYVLQVVVAGTGLGN